MYALSEAKEKQIEMLAYDPPASKQMPATQPAAVASSGSGAVVHPAKVPMPPKPPPAPPKFSAHQLLEREVAMPGQNEGEPISAVFSEVDSSKLEVFDEHQLQQLDLLSSGPFYNVGQVNEHPCFKQESTTDDSAGGLMLWWHIDETGKGHGGWYIAASCFVSTPDKQSKELQ